MPLVNCAYSVQRGQCIAEGSHSMKCYLACLMWLIHTCIIWFCACSDVKVEVNSHMLRDISLMASLIHKCWGICSDFAYALAILSLISVFSKCTWCFFFSYLGYQRRDRWVTRRVGCGREPWLWTHNCMWRAWQTISQQEHRWGMNPFSSLYLYVFLKSMKHSA